MAKYNVNLEAADLVGLLSDNKAFAGLIETVVNQVLDAQMTEHLGAEYYEHSATREGYRNGYRSRTLYTRVGSLRLRVPQTRDGSFSTDLFERYQRSEQAFVATLMEMYVSGVSTRKVNNITQTLCGASFSKSTVSELCKGLDAKLASWRKRPLSEERYPFLMVDALVVDIRRDEAIRSTGVCIVYGVNSQGQREPLDFLVADSENETSWDEVFKSLKKRGLQGVDLVVSDAHKGLVKALKKQFQGAQWQRCQTHFMRNILGHTPRHLRQEVAGDLKLIFQAQNKAMAKNLAKALIKGHEKKAKKAIDILEEGLEDALTVLGIPERYRKKLRTTNLPERMNEEIRRRQRVIRIFPNEEAAERLIGALLADKYDCWRSQKCYIDMTEYRDWKNQLTYHESNRDNVVAIN